MRLLPPHTALLAIVSLLAGCSAPNNELIDRFALVSRNNPTLSQPDTLASLTVGNGEFAFTVDATGLQSFPEAYANGIPLGTMAQWAWHSSPNPAHFRPEDALHEYDFGHTPKKGESTHPELYSEESDSLGRAHDAALWLRANPHRLHLGALGLVMPEGTSLQDVSNVHQSLDLWTGHIKSSFSLSGKNYSVNTICHPTRDAISASVSANTYVGLSLRFPYPTARHTDDACDWNADEQHLTTVVEESAGWALLRRDIDRTVYFINMRWDAGSENSQDLSPRDIRLNQTGRNSFILKGKTNNIRVTCEFLHSIPETNTSDSNLPSYLDTQSASANKWKNFWASGAAVDFSHCTDPRAKELERRVVLSQYLLAAQCAGTTPPQETGLTYNSWFGKFHLEMTWWHQAWQPLWGHPEMLARTMKWYENARPVARGIAKRQGFEGIRWMKMTDPAGIEAPSRIGSYLIWQQPHYIYMAELLFRSRPERIELVKYYDLVLETAQFMASFATRDSLGRYTLRGVIPAQETMRPAEVVNPPFELAYWQFGLSLAQMWRERAGKERIAEWDTIIAHMSPLAKGDEGLYLACETAPQTYKERRFTSDHMAVLGALGILPASPLVDTKTMTATAQWVWDNWNWDQTWGWDYPMTAMNATRLGMPDKAVDALLMDKRTNTYLPNGHNFQDSNLRCYLPGNGGLLTAIALMCAGWDGCETHNPGFPTDGSWDVRWEGLSPMP